MFQEKPSSGTKTHSKGLFKKYIVVLVMCSLCSVPSVARDKLQATILMRNSRKEEFINIRMKSFWAVQQNLILSCSVHQFSLHSVYLHCIYYLPVIHLRRCLGLSEQCHESAMVVYKIWYYLQFQTSTEGTLNLARQVRGYYTINTKVY